MENENIADFMSSISSMSKGYLKIDGSASNTSTEIFGSTDWKEKCRSYFNRHYKAENVITIASGKDKIVGTLTEVCSRNEGRGFVIENYDMITHLKILGYDKHLIKENINSNLQDNTASYLAYIEQRNLVLICKKMVNGCDINDCINGVVISIKCFIGLHINSIKSSNVKIVGLLIREQGQKRKSGDCEFCNLFIVPYTAFQLPSNFEKWLGSIGNYGNWKDLKPENESKLFINLAAEILGFMASQGREIPNLTDDISDQFKQTHLLYTPQQMNALFTDRKHIIIQGSYGSGKSILGLRKLEEIARNSPQESIIYLNFDSKSKLHFQMKKNVEVRTKGLQTKVKLTNSIEEVFESLDASIYVCYNSAGDNLSTILQKIAERRKINFHMVIEEYDGETLNEGEASKINNLIKSNYFEQSNIVMLAQSLQKSRQWSEGKKRFERSTCMFSVLEGLFNIINLKEVQRCSSEIFKLLSYTQCLVEGKDSVFRIRKEKKKPKKQLGNKPEIGKNNMDCDYEKTLILNEDLNEVDGMHFKTMSLDQAFESFMAVHSKKEGNNKILTRFTFTCKPHQVCEIHGATPNAVDFSKAIHPNSEKAVISLALILKRFIGKNKRTVVLYLTSGKPLILTKALFGIKQIDDIVSTENIEMFIDEDGPTMRKKVLSCSFHSLNGMEFDHVIILLTHSEYYLKYYLPQAISRCTHDLNLIFLPRLKETVKKHQANKTFNCFSRNKGSKDQYTIGDMKQEWMQKDLTKQWNVEECCRCEEVSIFTENDQKSTFKVHSHSEQYRTYIQKVKENMLSEDHQYHNNCSHATTM